MTSLLTSFRSCLLFALIGQALGHATLVSPNPRGQDGNLWYQVGCMIGCVCSGASSKELYVKPSTFGCTTPMEPTNNKASTRTWNVNNLSAQGDYAKYNPWRAPGHSIPLNGCGIASGFKTGGFERIVKGGQKSFYQSAVPNGYQAGDPGTNVPPLKSEKTAWTAGGTADVMFSIDVNHGGGYQYRLCPKASNAVTEDCFQQNPLAFASKEHTIRYSDGSRTDFQIPAVDVSEGVKPAGAAWRRFPVPTCNCDLGTACTTVKKESTALYKAPTATWAYATGTKENNCPTGLQFAKSWDDGYGYYGPNLAENEPGQKNGGKNSGDKEGSGKSEAGMGPTCMKLGNQSCDTNDKCKYQDFGAKGWFCWQWDANATAKGGRRLEETDHEHNEHHEHHEHRMLAVGDGTYRCSKCGYIYDPKKHDGKAFDAQPKDFKCPVCKSAKTMFRPASKYIDEVGTAPAAGYLWHIVDKVVVPTTPGSYVLSWRWDCEQTAQIWTNCADIEIEGPSSTSGTDRAKHVYSYCIGIGAMALSFGLLMP